jgi:parallel beta-helix repeat protein
MTKIVSWAIVLFCFSSLFSAEAAVFNVANVAEFQDALATAQGNGEDDTINLSPGTYTVISPLQYTAEESENFSLTIQGAAAGTTILDGGSISSILQIEQAFLSDGAEADIKIGAVTFRNGNEPSMSGGALYIGNYYAQTTIEDSVFQNNTALIGGGALYLSGWNSDLKRNTFTGNSATDPYSVGGAVYAGISGGTLSLDGNTFSDNMCAGSGAGLYATDSGPIVLTGNIFSGNVAVGEGGGGYLSADFGGSLTLSGNRVIQNSGSKSGGMFIASQSGPITLSGNVFLENIASTSSESNGGGLTVYSQNALKMVNNLFAGNTTSERGAGAMLQLYSNENQITNNTFVENTSTGEYDQVSSQGGGMYVTTDRNEAILHIYNNIFWGNTAAAPSHRGSDFCINDDGLNDGKGSVIHVFNNEYAEMEILRGDHFTQGGNIHTDPVLDADYRLLSGSPCIDTGDNSAPGLPETDLDGKPRVQDGNGSGTPIVDMGAYEWGATGSLQVTITPQDAIDAGAKWRVDGGAWNDSGSTQTGLSVGQHTVEFIDLPGWVKPDDQTVTLGLGQTTDAGGTYTTAAAETGSLLVTLVPPEVVQRGARWRVDGGAWHESGYTEAGLSVGQHTVEFSELTDWIKPGDQSLAISNDRTTTSTGIYTANQIYRAEGTTGTRFTIQGTGFGRLKGKVLIGDRSVAVSNWKSESIRCRLNRALDPGVYDITVVSHALKTDPIVYRNAFVVRNPEVRSIDQGSGRAGHQIAVQGKFFGARWGKVHLDYDKNGKSKRKRCTVLHWRMDRDTGESEIVFLVPRGLPTGTHDLIFSNGVVTKMKVGVLSTQSGVSK